MLTHKKFSSKSYYIILFLTFVFAGGLIYSNSFNSPFLFDDHHNIQSKAIQIKSLTFENILNVIFNANLKSRPVSNISFAINYLLGEYEVTGYHIFNLLIHLINAILVYLILRLVLLRIGDKTQKNSKKLRYINLAAFFTSLLFLLHPLQTQAVTYIVQRMASLAALFFLASFIFFIQFKIKVKQKEESTTQVHSRKWIYPYICSLLFAVLAMKTKENAFTLPFIFIIFDLIFFLVVLNRYEELQFPGA